MSRITRLAFGVIAAVIAKLERQEDAGARQIACLMQRTLEDSHDAT